MLSDYADSDENRLQKQHCYQHHSWFLMFFSLQEFFQTILSIIINILLSLKVNLNFHSSLY